MFILGFMIILTLFLVKKNPIRCLKNTTKHQTPNTWNLSISQHISSKTQPNLKNYGSLVNSFEFVSNLDQPGPCSSIRLEMAALQSHIVTFEIGRKIPYTFSLV